MKVKRSTVIKGISGGAAITFLVFATALDSGSWIPFVVCSICVMWLFIVALANSRG